MTTLHTDAVYEALSGLGSTVGEVARSLRDRGIKGVPAQAEHCPLANFLRAEFPEAHWVSVNGYDICLADVSNTTEYTVGTPDALGQFILRFDFKEFPDLVAEEPAAG